MRRFFWVAILLLLSSQTVGAELLRVRHHVGPSQTRVVLDLTQPTSYRVETESQGRALVVHAAVDFAAVSPMHPDRGPVRSVRSRSGSQLVLDLTAALEFRHFTLPAGEGQPDRIVIDVFGGTEASRESLAPPRVDRPYVVILDPGHGGADTGTPGCGVVLEKEVALAIAQVTAAILERHSGIEVVLTRTRDRAVSLAERVAIATRELGDLFISIHANSAPSPAARGAEVFFLSDRGASDEAAEALADRENAAGLVGANSNQAQDDELLSLLMDLQGTAILQRSAALAQKTLEEIEARVGTRGRTVKQARFAVLRSLAMPSVLFEAGFLSNADEARTLASAAGQRALGEALAAAIVNYLRDHGERAPLADPVPLRVHRVREGDTLWALARSYQTTVESLKRANQLTSGALTVGQQLVVP